VSRGQRRTSLAVGCVSSVFEVNVAVLDMISGWLGERSSCRHRNASFSRARVSGRDAGARSHPLLAMFAGICDEACRALRRRRE